MISQHACKPHMDLHLHTSRRIAEKLSVAVSVAVQSPVSAVEGHPHDAGNIVLKQRSWLATGVTLLHSQQMGRACLLEVARSARGDIVLPKDQLLSHAASQGHRHLILQIAPAAARTHTPSTSHQASFQQAQNCSCFVHVRVSEHLSHRNRSCLLGQKTSHASPTAHNCLSSCPTHEWLAVVWELDIEPIIRPSQGSPCNKVGSGPHSMHAAFTQAAGRQHL